MTMHVRVTFNLKILLDNFLKNIGFFVRFGCLPTTSGIGGSLHIGICRYKRHKSKTVYKNAYKNAGGSGIRSFLNFMNCFGGVPPPPPSIRNQLSGSASDWRLAGTRELGKGQWGQLAPHLGSFGSVVPPTLDCRCSFLFLFVFAHELGSLPKNSGPNRGVFSFG